MKYLLPIKIFSIVCFVIAGHYPAASQIYAPDGLRMPGTWNGWINNQNMGGSFDLVRISAGTLRWQTMFQHTSQTGLQHFKFVSTSFGDVWGNQWAANTNVNINQLSTFTYGTPSNPDNQVTLTQGRWYTVVFEDNGYANTRAIFMETSSQPAVISSVLQNPALVGEGQPVQITAVLNSTTLPSPEERFFVCYSINGWQSKSLVPMELIGNEISAFIPAQNSGTAVEYYVFSTVLNNPITDTDLVTINLNNNNGSNFSYTVDLPIECGFAVELVTSIPAFPIHNQPVKVYFNAEFGNGGLFNFTGDVYAHTGVITNLSTGPTDWRYVKTQWGQNTPETKMTREGDNLYSITIENPRTFYNVPAAEKILRIAFVFRSGMEEPGGYFLEHKNADGSDIFVEVYDPVLNVKIVSPTKRNPLVSPNIVLPVCVEAFQNTTLKLYINDSLLVEESTSSLSYPLVLHGMQPGSHWLKAVAVSGGTQKRDSVNIYLRGPVQIAPLPAGVRNGINYISNTSVTLVLHDPAGLKNFAFVVGDFNNWLPTDQGYMKRTPDGNHFWITLTGLQQGKEYAFQYLLDGKLRIADPFAEKILDPFHDRYIPTATYPNLKQYPFDLTTGIVSVLQTNQPEFQWQNPNFIPPALNHTQSDLLIYELLVRDFSETRRISDVKHKLDYLGELGVNAIKLMPIMEFDGNESWGYAPHFFFATDKYYGTRTDYKEFIDAAHQRGIAVILDIVPNHAFGGNPMVQMYFDPHAGAYGQPSADNPWFNQQANHPFSVGSDFNHESPYTRQFFKDVFEYWLTEFNVDGFRIDLSKGLTQTWSGSDMGLWGQYDQSRIDILIDYYNHIKSVNPNAYVILEHFADNSEETVLANTGMMLWSGMHDRYSQVSMGWPENSNVAWAHHTTRGWNFPNLIDYMENHDEERKMYLALTHGNQHAGYNIRDTLTALRHQEQALVLFLGIPGPKMLWQFQEMGYDYSIFYGGSRLANKPPRWDYMNQPARERLHRVISAMAGLRRSDAFRFGSFTHDLGGAGKRMWITHSSMDVVIGVNIGVAGFNMAPGFTRAGTWYDYFSGEPLTVTDPAGHTLFFGPGDYRVFTSQPLPKPFHHLNILVVDSIYGNPVEGVRVSLRNAGNRITSAEGKASFLSFPQNITVIAEKSGYHSKTLSTTVADDTTLTFRLLRDGTLIPESGKPVQMRIYPNPATDWIVVENAAGWQVTLFAMTGQALKHQRIDSYLHRMYLNGLAPGIYLMRFENKKNVVMKRLVVK